MNSEEKHQDARKDKKAGVPVKRVRKASGTFPELPDSPMKAKGPVALVPYSKLFNRAQAPELYKEGERPFNEDKMEVHHGITLLMKPLLDACQPSGQDRITFPTFN